MRKRKRFFILLLTLLCCVLSACGMNGDEIDQAMETKLMYEDAFKAKARQQYGENAVVTEVSPEIVTTYHGIWSVPTSNASGHLLGTIEVNGQVFDAVYNSEENLIYSTKNYETIRDSAASFLGFDDQKLMDITMDRRKLPDNILSYEDLLKHNYSPAVYLYTTADISGYEKDDFDQLYSYFASPDQHGTVIIVQMENTSPLAELKNNIRNIQGFEYSGENDGTCSVYDSDSHGYVDAFEKYGIIHSIYMNEESFVLR